MALDKLPFFISLPEHSLSKLVSIAICGPSIEIPSDVLYKKLSYLNTKKIRNLWKMFDFSVVYQTIIRTRLQEH
jgi:hypothetical protein